MDMQKWYDIVYTIELVGKNDMEKIKKSILIRTGKRENPLNIIKTYDEIKEYTEKQGYNKPMDYIKLNFHGKYSDIIKLGNKCLNKNEEKINNKTNNKINIVINNGIKNGMKNEITNEIKNETSDVKKEKKTNLMNNNNFAGSIIENKDSEEHYNNDKERGISKDIIEKPEKFKEEFETKECETKECETKETEDINIPADIKNKIIKNKKTMKYYREMGVKERELDNKYDYILNISQKDELGKFVLDNRVYLNKFPLIGKMFDDIDLEFRKIMDEIYNRDKKMDKNKNQWVKEIEILTQYFKNKLNIGEENEIVVKRLGVVVANLMKKLQLKIFETEDIEITRLLLNFKMQLGVFYSYYRKQFKSVHDCKLFIEKYVITTGKLKTTSVITQ